MTQLSTHFSLAEMTTTSTGLPNVPDAATLAHLQRTAKLMEEVRALLGSHPITVNSAYRSPEVNAAIGGSRTSDHCHGYACDWRSGHWSGEEAMALLAAAVRRGALVVDQLILYSTGMIHVSRRPTGNRGHLLRSQAASGSGGPYVAWVG